MIYALASLLSIPDSPGFDEFWGRIQRIFNIAGMALTSMPHFSWHVADSYEFGSLEPKLSTFVKTLEPISLHAAGIGTFSGDNPVIYLPVTKTPPIAAIHNEMSTWIGQFTSTTNPNYAPQLWIPHITLTSNEFNSDSVCQVISELAYIQIDIDLLVDQIAIIYRDENMSGVRKTYYFGEGQR